MKFFVMTTAYLSTKRLSNSQDAAESSALLEGLKSAGILEKFYVKIGGGSIYIVNADSLAEVRNAFRNSRLSVDHECEIREVIPETQNIER